MKNFFKMLLDRGRCVPDGGDVWGSPRSVEAPAFLKGRGSVTDWGPRQGNSSKPVHVTF